MNLAIQTHDPLIVVGLQTRTTNRDEANPASAKIGALYQAFFAQQIPAIIPNQVHPQLRYAVYSGYESDHTGAYDLLIGHAVSTPTLPAAPLAQIHIPTAQYLVFTASGTIPEVVTTTWQAIWDYFAKPGRYVRSYTADFERYDLNSPTLVEVFIAIEPLSS